MFDVSLVYCRMVVDRLFGELTHNVLKYTFSWKPC